MKDSIYIDSLERIIERHEKREKELFEALNDILHFASNYGTNNIPESVFLEADRIINKDKS